MEVRASKNRYAKSVSKTSAQTAAAVSRNAIETASADY